MLLLVTLIPMLQQEDLSLRAQSEDSNLFTLHCHESYQISFTNRANFHRLSKSQAAKVARPSKFKIRITSSCARYSSLVLPTPRSVPSQQLSCLDLVCCHAIMTVPCAAHKQGGKASGPFKVGSSYNLHSFVHSKALYRIDGSWKSVSSELVATSNKQTQG